MDQNKPPRQSCIEKEPVSVNDGPVPGKRSHKRFPVAVNARIVSGDACYHGIIGNVSEEGVGYTITTLVRTSDKFTPKSRIGLSFMIPSGETISLECEIRWYIKPAPEKNSLIIGMKIIDPPSEYLQWIKMIEYRQSEFRFLNRASRVI